MGKTPVDLPASIAVGRTIPLRPTTVSSPRGRRWPTTARLLPRRRRCRSSTWCRLRRSRSRECLRVLITGSTGSTGCVQAWRVSGRFLARPFRPRRMANDLGLLAPHAAARCVGGAHCDLDLPESTTTVATATNRQLERSAAVRVTPVGIAAGSPDRQHRRDRRLPVHRHHPARNRAAAIRPNPRLGRRPQAKVHARGSSAARSDDLHSPGQLSVAPLTWGSVHGAPSLVTKPMTTAVHQND